MNSYRALFDIQGFKGYCLWWAKIRDDKKQRWAAATLLAGRALSEDEAWGQVSRTLVEIPIEEVRREAMSWTVIRDHIRRPGEARRFEGSTAWAEIEAVLGDEGLAALGLDGISFRTAFDAELKRREQARYREFIDDLESVVFEGFCRETGRDFHDRSPETMAAYARWKAGRFGMHERQRERQDRTNEWFEQFRRAFTVGTVNTRANDLAALGLASTATAGDIKTTWRRLAMRHHPDRGGDHGEFIRLKAAYERLSGEAGL